MAGEEAFDEADLITDKKPESQAEKAGAGDEAAIEPGEFVAGERKGQREGGGNQHHSGDGANSKNQQIEDGPFRFADGA